MRPFVFSLLFTFCLFAQPLHAGSVALTIDDGPQPAWTAAALQVAQKYGATLTFFVVGQHIQAHPEVLPTIVAAGHEVENHTYNHPALPGLPTNMMEWQLRRTAELIREQTGHHPVFLRPPYGAFSRRTGRAIAATGHRLALWTVDPKDWDGKSADEIVHAVLSRIRAGSVVLLHQRPATLTALPKILAGCRSRGLQCVSLRELWSIPGSASGAAQLAPLRSLTDEATAVAWQDNNKTAVLRRGDLAIRFRVGERAAVINGAQVELPAAPALYRGQLYVPDAFIGEALAETVESTELGQRATERREPLLVAAATSATADPAAASPSSAPANSPPIVLTPEPTQPEGALSRHLHAGLEFKRRREYAAAADELLAATRYAPESAEAHWALAWTLEAMRLHQWARREFARVAQLDPAGSRGRKALLLARKN